MFARSITEKTSYINQLPLTKAANMSREQSADDQTGSIGGFVGDPTRTAKGRDRRQRTGKVLAEGTSKSGQETATRKKRARSRSQVVEEEESLVKETQGSRNNPTSASETPRQGGEW